MLVSAAEIVFARPAFSRRAPSFKAHIESIFILNRSISARKPLLAPIIYQTGFKYFKLGFRL